MGKVYSIIGLGKLGASMAAAIASKGYEVIGVDINKNAVELLNEGHAPVQETKLEETIAANKNRLRATINHEDAILNSDLSFVIVPTPSNEQGAFSLQYAAWAFRKIGHALAGKNSYHNIVLTSTVLPGSLRYGLLPILEKESGKVCGKDFGLCYSPEFIALGSVIHDFLNPDFTLIGEFDEKSGGLLESCYADILNNNPPCQRMSIENAELTKIALNTFITTKITFANMLVDLCERIPGGNVDVVTTALGLDRRIGRHYLTGALGYGGPCFPRDNVALSFIAQALDTKAALAETTNSLNRSLAEKVVNKLRAIIKPGDTVAVLGLAYKPFSYIVEESQGIKIAIAIANTGARVISFDPMAYDMARTELLYHGVVLNSLKDCLEQANVILITTPDPIFRNLSAKDFTNGQSSVTVVDFWRILSDKLSGHNNIRYIPMGLSNDDELNASRLNDLWKGTTQY